MKTEYCIIENYQVGHFQEEVNKKLDEGWILHGDTSIVTPNQATIYSQAFVRQKK